MHHPKSALASKLSVALLRVSTDKQFQEGESIETQRRKVEFAATRYRTDIVRFFTEHYSGRKTDRRILEEMLAYLEENRDIETVFIGDIDRLTRGGSEVYLQLRRRLRGLQVALVDTTGIIQPERNRLEHLGVEYEWSVASPSHIAEIFMAEKAKTEASDILTRTIGQQIQLTREGYQVRPANFGYRNLKVTIADGTRKTILEPDPEEAKFVRRMYELRSEGDVPDEQIVQHINAMGYRSRGRRVFDPATRRVIGHTGHQLLTVKGLQKLIKKPIYCGIRNDAWNMNEPVEAPMEPIVTLDMFNRANRGQVIVTKRADGKIKIEVNPLKYKNHRDNGEFLLRHVVTCPTCQKPMLASKSRNKVGKYFGYYHCSRGHKYFGVNKAEFESTVANSLGRLQAKPGFLPLFREVARDVWVQKNKSKKDEQDAIQGHIAALRRKQEALVDRIMQVHSPIVQSKLEAQIEEQELAIGNAEASLSSTALKEDQIEAYFQIAKKLMEHPSEHVFSAATKHRLEKIWRFIFIASPNYDVLRNGTPQLSLLYRFNRDFADDKDQLVGQLALHWNTFEGDLRAALGQGLDQIRDV